MRKHGTLRTMRINDEPRRAKGAGVIFWNVVLLVAAMTTSFACLPLSEGRFLLMLAATTVGILAADRLARLDSR